VIVSTNCALSIISEHPHRTIQIIFSGSLSVVFLLSVFWLNSLKTQILVQFDLDCVCVSWDGNTVRALPRAFNAIAKRYNLFRLSKDSSCYAFRLFKYRFAGNLKMWLWRCPANGDFVFLSLKWTASYKPKIIVQGLQCHNWGNLLRIKHKKSGVKTVSTCTIAGFLGALVSSCLLQCASCVRGGLQYMQPWKRQFHLSLEE
jgi:hypothetical protein